MKIVYSPVGSSGAGVYDTLFPPSGTGGIHTLAATAYYLTGAPSCTFTDAAQPTDVIGVSDVYPSSLAGVAIGSNYPTMPSPVTLPADVVDTLGPVQAFTISVHDDPSFPVAISDAAAFNVFGVTGRGGQANLNVAPWTVIGEIYGRGQGSGTWQTWSRNLGLDPSRPVTSFVAGTGDVLSGLTSHADAAAIGIVALNDLVAALTAATAEKPVQARPLAFQAKAKGQTAAFYTSSTATATDMINVRDGHYQTWANLHFLAHKTGAEFSTNVKAVLALLETQQAIQAVAKIRAVPNCAMQVSRSADAGDFSVYKPAKPCGCFFEASSAGTPPATCKTCTADADCGASGQCDFGYCEAK